jgi:hypothetical protein
MAQTTPDEDQFLTEPRPTHITAKQIALVIAQGGISLALIIWVLRDVQLHEAFAVMRTARLPFLLGSFLLLFVTYFLRAHRWRVLLKAQGAQARVSFLVLSYIISSFFNTFLPSTIGGDLFRIYDSLRLGIGKTSAATVVLVDRLSGTVALTIFAAGAFLASPHIAATLPALLRWLGAGTLGGLLVMWLVFLPPLRVKDFLAKVTTPSLRWGQRLAQRVFLAFEAFKQQKGTLGSVLGLSLLLQGTIIFRHYLIALALGLAAPLSDFALTIPLALFILMVPVSINGIGLRENVFVFFFALLGIAKPQALAFSWLVYGTAVLHGLLGGILYAFRPLPLFSPKPTEPER